MRSLRLRCAWLGLEELDFAGNADKRRKNLTMRMSALCIPGRTIYATRVADYERTTAMGPCTTEEREAKRKKEREKNELTAGLNAWMDGDCFGSG